MCTEVLYKIFKTRLHSVLNTGTNNVKVWISLCLIHVVLVHKVWDDVQLPPFYPTVDRSQEI